MQVRQTGCEHHATDSLSFKTDHSTELDNIGPDLTGAFIKVPPNQVYSLPVPTPFPSSYSDRVFYTKKSSTWRNKLLLIDFKKSLSVGDPG